MTTPRQRSCRTSRAAKRSLRKLAAPGGLRRWRRIAVLLIIVSLSVAAVVGIVALLLGTFTQLQGRIMLTTLLIGVTSVLALCNLAGIDRDFRWVCVTGLTAAALTLIVGLVLIWTDWRGATGTEVLWKTFGIAGIAAVSAAHASLLLLLGRRRNPVVRVGLWVTLALITVLFVLVAVLIVTSGDVATAFYARAIGTVAILDVLGTIVIPVVALFLRERRPASAPVRRVTAPPSGSERPGAPAPAAVPDVVTPFTSAVPDAVLDDLHVRLARTRYTARTPGGDAWSAGTDPGYLRELVDYWLNEFDWRARESWLNSFPQYTTTIDGHTLHFVHVRGRGVAGGPAPIPLLVSHGWPYSFADMLGIVPFLTDPVAHGGSASDAFDVIVPSLPGFGFSQAPSDPATPEGMASTLHRLMTEQLGYPRYAVYGEDVGAHVSDWLAATHPDAVIGIHTSHPAYPPASQRTDMTPAENAFTSWLAKRWEGEAGYSAMQATKPDTLAAGLVDSPAGLAAWIVEKFRGWSDSQGDPEYRFSKEDLLTTVMIYWVTASIGTSFRPYHDERYERELPPVTVPAGITIGLADQGMPREFAARTYRDIRFWNELTRGGHFLAKEEPALVSEDIRVFFRTLR